MLLDTPHSVQQIQTEAQRRLGGEGRLLTACRMSQTLRQLAFERIQRTAPDLSESEVLERLVAELYGIHRDA